MAKLAFQMINSITLKNHNFTYETQYIGDFEEYDDQIIFETGIQIDGICRGWVGDLYYHIGKAFDIETCKDVDNVTYAAKFTDVLLARVTISASPDKCVTWKYTFLKD